MWTSRTLHVCCFTDAHLLCPSAPSSLLSSPLLSVTLSTALSSLSCGTKTLLDAGRALEGKHFKCLRNYTSNNGFAHIHTRRRVLPGADSDTKEVEVTLSVSRAINLCHLKRCVAVCACVQMCSSQQLAGSGSVCVCVCVLT